jgi:putative colanic acid biosynthesis glycosyltransferase
LAAPVAKAAPLLAIVTVTRDDLSGLRRTHASLRIQTWQDFEWIVVDGGSTDGTPGFLERHRQDIAWSRSAPDQGLYHAMALGLAAVRADYVLFLNGGDALASPNTLVLIADALNSTHADFLYGDAWEIMEDGVTAYKPARSHRRAWYGMFTHHQAMVYSRHRIGGLSYNLNYKIGADYAFTLQFLARARRIVRLNAPVCRFAPGGCAQLHASLGRREQRRIREEFLGHGPVRGFFINCIQSATYFSKKVAPSLFRALRCRIIDHKSL